MSDRRHTIRWAIPHSIVYGQSTTIEAPVYLSGSLVAPTSGALTAYNGADTKILDAVAVTVASSIATYTIPAATVADEEIGDGWRFVWALTLATGDVLVAENDGALVKRALYNVVTDADIMRGRSALDPASTSCITNLTTYQDEIDEAWVEVEGRLYEDGRRPEWIRSPSSLRKTTLSLTLATIYEDLANRGGDLSFEAEAARWRERYEAAYTAAKSLMDRDGDGDPDTDTRDGLRQSVVWL